MTAIGIGLAQPIRNRIVSNVRKHLAVVANPFLRCPFIEVFQRRQLTVPRRWRDPPIDRFTVPLPHIALVKQPPVPEAPDVGWQRFVPLDSVVVIGIQKLEPRLVRLGVRQGCTSLFRVLECAFVILLQAPIDMAVQPTASSFLESSQDRDTLWKPCITSTLRDV